MLNNSIASTELITMDLPQLPLGSPVQTQLVATGAMKLFNIIAVLITLSAAFSYINHRFIRLPTTIGLMIIALLLSLGMIILGPFGLGLEESAHG